MRLTISIEVPDSANLPLALRDAFVIARRMPDMEADLWRLRDPKGQYRGFIVVEGTGHELVTEPPEKRCSRPATLSDKSRSEG